MNVNFPLLLAKISPLVYFGIALILMVLLDYFMPLSHMIFIPLRILGGLIFLGGIFIIFKIAKQYEQEGTPIKYLARPTTILTTGPYRYSRNPVYLAMLLSLLGAWIALASLSPVIIIIGFFFLLDRCIIPQEEIFLEAEQPQKYLDYKYQVRRWL